MAKLLLVQHGLYQNGKDEGERFLKIKLYLLYHAAEVAGYIGARIVPATVI